MWLLGLQQQRQMEVVTSTHEWWRDDGCWPLTCSSRCIFDFYLNGVPFKDPFKHPSLVAENAKTDPQLSCTLPLTLCCNSNPFTQQNSHLEKAKPRKMWETSEVLSSCWKCLLTSNINIEIWNATYLSNEINFKVVIFACMHYQKSEFENKWLPKVPLTKADIKVRFFVTLLKNFMRI